MRRIDRATGIVLGLVLGVAIVAGFVFLGSESTIDAPRISGIDTGKSDGGAGRPEIPVVRVIGGAPPVAGPVQIETQQGRRLRFRVVSDAAIGAIEIPGLGVSEQIEAGTNEISFRPERPGQFPVIVAASNIGIASLRVVRAP
jgi:hypothetical protein